MGTNINARKPHFRMYCLVMYNISPIQQGIQAAHAIVEYSNKLPARPNPDIFEYDCWANDDKTIIILNGGTSNDMKKHWKTLMKNKIRAAQFKEPDLNKSMSAIAFIVSHEVWDKKKFPDILHSDGTLDSDATVVKYDMYGDDQWLRYEFLPQFKLA